MIDLVVFDCDGVLIDSEIIGPRVEAEVLGSYGIEIAPEVLLRRFLGMTTTAAFAALARESGVELPADLEERIQPRLNRAFEAELQPMPFVQATLDRLAELRLAVCVASSSSHERLAFTLGLVGLYDRLAPHVFSAQDVEAGKPAPDLFLHAARSMGVPPGRCLVLEDSDNGVRASQAAAMTTIGFTGGSHRRATDAPDLLALGARQVIDDLRALPEVVEALRQG